MPIEVGIWRIDNGDVRRVNAAALEAERRLEDVLVKGGARRQASSQRGVDLVDV